MAEILKERLKEALGKAGLSAQAASRAAGLGDGFARDILNGTSKSPRAEGLAKLAAALGVSAAWLTGEDAQPGGGRPPRGADIPVFGTAAAATAGAMQVGDDAIEWLPRPPGLVAVRDVYALYVTGSSMEPRYRAGDLVFVSPHRPARIGDDVVVQTAENGEIRSWLKTLAARRDGDVVTLQYNPPAEIVHKGRHVVAVHRVLRLEELLGI